jgi:superfamily II DNA helicase RecQ
MGPTKVDRYGADLIALCRGNTPPSSSSEQTLPQRKADAKESVILTLSSPKGERSRRTPPPSTAPKPSAPSQPRLHIVKPPNSTTRTSATDQTHRGPATTQVPRGFSLGSHSQLEREGALAPAKTSAVHENKRPTPPPPPAELTPTQQALETRLKDWRREAAKAAGLPTFFILSDTVLRNITLATPTTLEALHTIRGLSPEKLNQFAPTILSLCRA